MNSNSQRVVQTDALPPNVTNPLPPGANNIYTAGIIKQNNQNEIQNKLTNYSGGYKRRQLKGGNNPVIVVPSAPSYAVDQQSTNINTASIASLANSNKIQSALDSTVNGTQSDVAKISANQQSLYNGKGGYRKKNKKKTNKRKKNKKTKKYTKRRRYY